MRILLVHNFYGSSAPSGENQVVAMERELLEEHGHEVQLFARYSDEIRSKGLLHLVRGGASVPWNPFSARAIGQAVDAFRPDVVHAHNTFPLISPAIFRAIGDRAGRVLTLHNYRLFCPGGSLTNGARVCTACLDAGSPWPSLVRGCYRHSRIATVPLAVSVALHRAAGTWNRHVEAFIALTDFQRERMVASGLPAVRVHVKPNFFKGEPAPLPWSVRGDHAVFAGRLTPEKGVEVLVRAWCSWGERAPALHVLGDGPLRPVLGSLASSRPGVPIRFFGQVSGCEAERQISTAKLLVLPSVAVEAFPLVLREAFAFGTPAAVSNLGPLPSIVRPDASGIVFEPGDPGSLLREVRAAWENPARLERLGRGARAEFDARYDAETNYAVLMKIYGCALAERKRRADATSP